MASANPLYDPGDSFTGVPSAADLEGARLVTVAAAKRNGQPTPIAHCGATDVPIGVLLQDTPRGGRGTILAPGGVLEVTAGGAVAFRDEVEVIAAGRVQRLASGRRVGTALAAAASGEAVLIQFQL